MVRRYAARVDNNQGVIVAELRALGFAVYLLRQPVDLLVYHPPSRRYLIGDVKNPEDRRRDKRTKAQKDFMLRWPGPVPLWESTEDALRSFGLLRTVSDSADGEKGQQAEESADDQDGGDLENVAR